MKKLVLLLIAPFVLFSTLSAQITQEQADEMIQQRLEGETKSYCLYAQENVQEAFEMTTSSGETLELDYSCWVYYVSYGENTAGKYLIVKETNGNLLEINAKNDTGPDDLMEWREVSFEIEFTEYSLEGTSCQWINLNYDETVIVINNDEELKNHISCSEGDYPGIDFTQHTLLLISGEICLAIENIAKKIRQLTCNEYILGISILLNDKPVTQKWTIALIVGKMNEESTIELIVESFIEGEEYPIEISFEDLSWTGTSCQWMDSPVNELIIINSYEEWQSYFTCTDDIFPEVDFEINTLVLVRVGAPGPIEEITENIQKLSPCNYVLNIEIWQLAAGWPSMRTVSLVVNKISESSQFELNMTMH